MLRNIVKKKYAFFGKKHKKMLKKQICVLTPVITVFIFDDDLQDHMKQKCETNE